MKLLRISFTLFVAVSVAMCGKEEDRNPMINITPLDNIADNLLLVYREDGPPEHRGITVTTNSYSPTYYSFSSKPCPIGLELIYDYMKGDEDYFAWRYWAPYYLYARISEPIRVVSDCRLFGRDPGTDLADLFVVTFAAEDARLLASYSEEKVVGKYLQGMPLLEYYAVGLMPFGNNFVINFSDTPPEQPSSYTITLEIPLETKSLVETGWLIINPVNPNAHPTAPQRTLKGSVTITR